MTGDQKAFHLLAGHNCLNCGFCQDMMLTEIEVNEFLCSKEWNCYCEFAKDLICEDWKEECKTSTQ